MENLWAPWRMAFIDPKVPTKPGCIFCTQPAEHRDPEHHILHRGERCFMMLNLYPYNNGHLMIAPYEHVGALEEVDAMTLGELMAQVQLALRALRTAINPDGFNMGINQGKVAGAGFADHIHYHIVPRWYGDTNFMPVVADVKVIPEHLDVMYQKLLEALKEIKTCSTGANS
jgi:ATP adenylyltransferase